MADKIFGTVILSMVLLFGITSVEIDAQPTGGVRINESDLVGMWVLEDAQNVFKWDLVDRMALFNDQIGLDNFGEFTWRVVSGNRIYIDGYIYDIELAENGSLLIFLYDGHDYAGHFPAKGFYRKQ